MDLGLGTPMSEDEPVQRDIFVESEDHPMRTIDETEKEANMNKGNSSFQLQMKVSLLVRTVLSHICAKLH